MDGTGVDDVVVTGNDNTVGFVDVNGYHAQRPGVLTDIAYNLMGAGGDHLTHVNFASTGTEAVPASGPQVVDVVTGHHCEATTSRSTRRRINMRTPSSTPATTSSSDSRT